MHHSTGLIPYAWWHRISTKLPPLLIFGQIGYIPKLPTRVNLIPYSLLARYLFMYYIRTVVVQPEDGVNHQVIVTDFHQNTPSGDLTRTHSATFPSFIDRLRHIPATIAPGITPLFNVAHALKFRYYSKWVEAYNVALSKFY